MHAKQTRRFLFKKKKIVLGSDEYMGVKPAHCKDRNSPCYTVAGCI